MTTAIATTPAQSAETVRATSPSCGSSSSPCSRSCSVGAFAVGRTTASESSGQPTIVAPTDAHGSGLEFCHAASPAEEGG